MEYKRMNLAQLKHEYNTTDNIQKRIILRKILDSRIKRTNKKENRLINTYISFIKNKKNDMDLDSGSVSDGSIEISDIESVGSINSNESSNSSESKEKKNQRVVSIGNKLLERFMTEADFRNKRPSNRIIKPYYDDGKMFKRTEMPQQQNKTLGRRRNIK